MIKKYLNHILMLFMIQFFLSTNLFSQNKSGTSVFTDLKTDVYTSLSGAGHVLSSPYNWQANDWINFSIVLGTAASVTIFEKDIRNFFLKNHNNTLNKFSNFGEIYGEPLTVILLTGTLYGTGLMLNDNWLRETSVILTASLIPSGIIQTAAKMSGGRVRPYLELDNLHFELFRQEEDYYSFVSGHTFISVTTSWILAKRINNNIAKTFLYTAGMLGALSRIYVDKHWMSDVILGGALGIFSANSVMNWIDKKKNGNKNQTISWYLFPQKNKISFTINW